MNSWVEWRECRYRWAACPGHGIRSGNNNFSFFLGLMCCRPVINFMSVQSIHLPFTKITTKNKTKNMKGKTTKNNHVN